MNLLKSVEAGKGYCVYPAKTGSSVVWCPEGQFVDGWNSINSATSGFKGLSISCSDPVKKSAGAPVVRKWKLVKEGPAVAADVNRKYIHTTKYICGIELVDRSLVGDTKGIDDTGIRYCDYVPTNGSVDISYMGTPLRKGTYVDAGDALGFNAMMTATYRHRD